MEDFTLKDLEKSSVLQRATAFSISQIGETMSKIESLFKIDFPNVPWQKAKSMRNFIVYDYESIDIEILYKTVKQDLPSLKTQMRIIQDSVENKKITLREELF